MKSPSNTEREMRDEAAPTPETVEELGEYITSLTNKQNDYGMGVYAVSLSAVAAYNHVASKLGVTGFMASCADLDIIRRTRGMDGPFMLIKAEDMLYPQYDLHAKLAEAMRNWEGWAADRASELLKTDNGWAVPDVRAHWEKLAALKQS